MPPSDHESALTDTADPLVTIARYLNPLRAQMAKGLLRANGIESFLQGETANQMLSMAFRARLRVARADEALAHELLEGTGDDDNPLDDPSSGADATDAPIGILPEAADPDEDPFLPTRRR